jgi:hypothetical protein
MSQFHFGKASTYVSLGCSLPCCSAVISVSLSSVERLSVGDKSIVSSDPVKLPGLVSKHLASCCQSLAENKFPMLIPPSTGFFPFLDSLSHLHVVQPTFLCCCELLCSFLCWSVSSCIWRDQDFLPSILLFPDGEWQVLGKGKVCRLQVITSDGLSKCGVYKVLLFGKRTQTCYNVMLGKPRSLGLRMKSIDK